jgi:hypothetical protein
MALRRDRTVIFGASGLALALLTAFSFLLVTPAWAHGEGGDPETDVCEQRVGRRYVVHMGVYQPATSGFQEFCRDLPAFGETVLVFDLVDEALKTLPIAVKIVEAGETQDGPVLTELPQKIYPLGVIETNVNLQGNGEYAAILEVAEGAEQQAVGRFRVRVAPEQSGAASFIALAAGLLIVGGGVYYFMNRRRQAAKS